MNNIQNLLFIRNNFLSCLKICSFHLNTVNTMSQKMSGKTIAVCQMTSKKDKENNFRDCVYLIQKAKQQKAVMVFLPEACDYIAECASETLAMAEPLDGQFLHKFQELAKDNDMWLSLGGVHEQRSDGKINNTHVMIDPSGRISGLYRKTHLFDVDLPDKGIHLVESDYVVPGQEIATPINTPIGKVGLAVCYDLRFPEISTCLVNLGAEVLTFPSAFTESTGAAHWEVLLRARAIETQCYVVAAAQTGTHNSRRSSWGHAMVVDPWGTVIAQCSEGVSLALAEICPDIVKSVRAKMPVITHRRHDLYPKLMPLKSGDCGGSTNEVYQFGQVTVRGDAVFYRTPCTIAFTNKRCVVVGHTLVAPVRQVERLTQLTSEEISDLFRCVQRVQRVLEDVYETSSSTITVQDGQHAGQTIKHVHVHILPRRPGDFEQNDQVYYELQKHDKNPNTGKWRTEDEMAQEAATLRSKMMQSILYS